VTKTHRSRRSYGMGDKSPKAADKLKKQKAGKKDAAKKK
jgi:hypothetical protein